jgi:hypothetical protein
MFRTVEIKHRTRFFLSREILFFVSVNYSAILLLSCSASEYTANCNFLKLIIPKHSIRDNADDVFIGLTDLPDVSQESFQRFWILRVTDNRHSPNIIQKEFDFRNGVIIG